MRAPNTFQAVDSTQGIIATYNNDPILAYYFAHSNGSTISSYDANMTAAPVAYLQAKLDPPSQGQSMLGHGSRVFLKSEEWPPLVKEQIILKY